MATFRCPRCGAAFPEAGFCPHDGSRLGEDAASIDDGTPTVPSAQMVAVQPAAGAFEPSGMFKMVSAAENTAEAVAAFHANSHHQSEYDRLIGQTLDGRYLIERKLGEGGMGVVFAARHAVIERPLAVKVLKREVMRDTATIKRFVQEAKAASRIGHPNIIDVTDFGTTPDGMTYQVMEFVDGLTLGQAIKKGAPFKPSRSIRIAAQIARALGAAHDKGIVHRDLKPENIFLTDRDGRRDFVKIVDFGIAKVAPVEGQVVDGPRLTRAGAVFGTPEYMAPEQAAGRGDTDGRVDVYALGVILYEMTTGKVPHKGDTMVRTLAMQMLDPPVPPSKLRPDLVIPADFEEVILHALTKKREQRYATMGELLHGLEKVAGASLSEPVSVAASVGPERAFTLAPLPPGADAARVRSARPSMPLLDQRSKRPSMPMASSGSGSDSGGDSGLPRSRPHDSAPMPIGVPVSTGDAPRLALRGSGAIGAVTTNDGSRPGRRMKNEPQFVSGARPVVSIEHAIEDDPAAMPAPRRWPWIAMAALFAAGLGVMIAVTLHKPKATAVIPVVVSVPIDARAPEPVPIVDAAVVIVVPPDADLRLDARRRDAAAVNRDVRDARPGPGPDARPRTVIDHGLPPGERGAIKVITSPEGGYVYTDRTYRGPSGVIIQEEPGSKKRVHCELPGYEKGVVDVTWNEAAQTIVCPMKRIKRCLDNIKNPFDDCP